MKKMKHLALAFLTLCLILSCFPTSAHAAGKVKLAKNNVTLSVNETYKIKIKNATTWGKKHATYKSSKKTVASVNKNGKITAKSQGKAKITVKVSGKKLVCKVSVSDDTSSNNNTSNEPSFVEQVVALVNEERTKAGLSPVTATTSLMSAAQARAVEVNSYFSHTRPNGSTCFTMLDEYHISYSGAGENIAAGQKSPADVMNSWMNSSGHRANILNADFTFIGVGYYNGSWVQMFTYN